MSQIVRVSAPSRLHFGLLRFACQSGRSYGGLGMMLEGPRTVVEVSWSDDWDFRGPSSRRARHFAEQTLRSLSLANSTPLRVHVLSAPAPHSGLGSGTQLALSVAAGLRTLAGQRNFALEDLVASVGRGDRGAVGSHGFIHGGLIWEQGKLSEQTLGELGAQSDLPKSWRVLLIGFPNTCGISGADERQAFRTLPPVAESTTQSLTRLAEETILPACNSRDFASFSEGIYQYGMQAGQCFAPLQYGPFANPQVAEAVSQLRTLGVAGVGQSSWGPTVFAFCETVERATALVEQLPTLDVFSEAKFHIAAADAQGARIESRDAALQQSIADERFSQ